MCAPAVVGVVGAAVQAKAQKDQADYQAQAEKNNAALAGYQRDTATQQGGFAAGDITAQGAKVGAAAKAQLEGSGVDSTSGSAADLLTANSMAAAQDAARVKANAALSAWGFGNEAQNRNAQAGVVKRAGYMGALGTGVQGLSTAAEYYARSRNTGGG